MPVAPVFMNDEDDIMPPPPKTQKPPTPMPPKAEDPEPKQRHGTPIPAPRREPTAFKSKDEPMFDTAQRWMNENPQVMAIFERLAFAAADKGRKFGIKLLAERVRWEYTVEMTQDPEDTYKINNNYTAYIGRELIHRHPRLADFIELRRLQDVADPDDCPF